MDRPVRLIDLFAGIGGIRQGFGDAATKLGQPEPKCVFTSEWDRFAQETYRANFPGEHVYGDITDPAVQDAIPHGDYDILLAGFPCQPFSLAGVSKKTSLGRPHGFADLTQGTLFHEIVEILKPRRIGGADWQPPAFLLENVKHLRRHDRGQTWEVISEALDELGYTWDARIINADRFVPQGRERIYIIGYRADLDLPAFDFDGLDLTAGSPLPVGPILHENNDEHDLEDPHWTRSPGTLEKYTLSDHLWQYLQGYAAKHRASGNGFGFGLIDQDSPTRTLSARYHKDGSEILVPLDDAVPPRHVRRLTPRECARLQGYDDTFRIVCSDTQAYRQFGNSVAVPVIARLATQMLEDLAGVDASDRDGIAA